MGIWEAFLSDILMGKQQQNKKMYMILQTSHIDCAVKMNGHKIRE